MLHRPEVNEEIIEQIKTVIATNPYWNRSKISQHLCEVWDWRMPDGQLKDISCRDLLRLLDKKGAITLPMAQKAGNNRTSKNKYRQIFFHNETPIETDLSVLRPLSVKVIEENEQVNEFKSYIEQFHYLGFERTVGENLKYMVYSAEGRLLACLLFGSAAWSCRDRDDYIGWDRGSRKAHLQEITNNVRFLIPEWIKVPHLASHALSLVCSRLSRDWEKKYGHPIHCLETFVEQPRFRGICYRAANWVYVGKTTGRGRDDIDKTALLPIKDIYLYPLHKKFRQLLGGRSSDR